MVEITPQPQKERTPLTTSEQMEALIRNGYGIGWIEKHKMFWAIVFDKTDDRKYGWLKESDWKLPTDICAGDTLSDAVSRTYKNLIERAGLDSNPTAPSGRK